MKVDRLRRWVPSWWSGDAGLVGDIVSAATLPIEGAFRVGNGVRSRLYDQGVLRASRVPVPVVSIGNLTVGGTGKTPIATWIARRLREQGKNPWILLRGYGMDEVEVHREINPEVSIGTGRNRIESANEAVARGADCLILDDGFQHRRLHRDLDVVLVSAEQWGRRRRLLPRGPWREPPSAMRRASFVVVTRKSSSRSAAEAVLHDARRFAPDRPTALAHLTLTSMEPLDSGSPATSLREGDEVAAISSLGNPEAFEEQLREMGAVVRPVRFPDHHVFTATDVTSILSQARGSTIVMTRKEAVKLRGMMPTDAGALVANQGILFESGEAELLQVLHDAVG